MVASMEQVTVLVAILASLALGYSIRQLSQLAILSIRQPGIGRILFLSHTSLKLWAALVLAYFIVNSTFPGWAGDDALPRLAIRLFLGVYLLVQPIAVNIALWRWKRSDDYGEQPVAGKAPRLLRKVRIATRRFARAGRKARQRLLRRVRKLRRGPAVPPGDVQARK